MNFTLPVGVVVDEVTVAVNLTFCPTFEGFSEDTTAVVVVALSTTCFSDLEVLPECAASPAYVAVMVEVPTLSVDIFSVAAPLLRFLLPSEVLPLLKVTVPVGVVPDVVTVAVKSTIWP